jgi:hypothetical protein
MYWLADILVVGGLYKDRRAVVSDREGINEH